MLAEAAVVGLAGFEKNNKYFLIFEPTYSLIPALPPRDMFFFFQPIHICGLVRARVCMYIRERQRVCIIRSVCASTCEGACACAFVCVRVIFFCESVCVRVRKIEDYLSETNSSIKGVVKRENCACSKERE